MGIENAFANVEFKDLGTFFDVFEKNVEKYQKKMQDAELTKLDILRQLPIGMTAEFTPDGMGGFRTQLKNVGTSDPRFQNEVALTQAKAAAEAQARALQYHFELPDRLSVFREEGKVRKAIERIRQEAIDARSQERNQESLRRSLIQKGFQVGEGGALVPLPETPEKKAAEKEKRLSEIAGDVARFTTGSTPQPELAALAASRLRGRGPRAQAAIEAAGSAKAQAKPEFGISESRQGNEVLTAFRQEMQAFTEPLLPEVGEAGEAGAMSPQELAEKRTLINAKIDELRQTAFFELESRLAHNPEAIRFFKTEFDRQAALYNTGYAPPEQTFEETPAPPRAVSEIQADQKDAIRDAIAQAKQIANEPLSSERRPSIGFDTSAALLFGKGKERPKGGSTYSDEAIQQARRFSKLPKDRQFKILAERILKGGSLSTAPPGPFPQLPRQSPIPPASTRPR